MGERLLRTQENAGSSPARSTIGPVVQLEDTRLAVSESGFDSLLVHQRGEARADGLRARIVFNGSTRAFRARGAGSSPAVRSIEGSSAHVDERPKSRPFQGRDRGFESRRTSQGSVAKLDEGT